MCKYDFQKANIEKEYGLIAVHPTTNGHRQVCVELHGFDNMADIILPDGTVIYVDGMGMILKKNLDGQVRCLRVN